MIDLAAWRAQVDTSFRPAASKAAALYPTESDAEVRPAVSAMFADAQFGTSSPGPSRAAGRPQDDEEVAHAFGPG